MLHSKLHQWPDLAEMWTKRLVFTSGLLYVIAESCARRWCGGRRQAYQMHLMFIVVHLSFVSFELQPYLASRIFVQTDWLIFFFLWECSTVPCWFKCTLYRGIDPDEKLHFSWINFQIQFLAWLYKQHFQHNSGRSSTARMSVKSGFA